MTDRTIDCSASNTDYINVKHGNTMTDRKIDDLLRTMTI